MGTRRLLAAAATILFAQPTNAHAQFKSEFAVVLGTYLPTNQVGLRVFVGSDICTEHPDTPDCPTTAPKRSENRGVTVGGRWTGWLGKGAGIEGSLWFASGGVAGTTFLSSLRGVFRFDPHAQTSVVLFAGPAMVNRFEYPDDLASFGGTVGIGLDLHPRPDLRLRAQIEDYLYNVQPKFGDGLFQQDFVVSLSLGLERR